MATWFGNLRTIWKLMIGFALMSVFVCVLGSIAAQGLTEIRETLRVVYEDYTVAGTDLATVANNLNRTRTNDFMALDTTNKDEFDAILKRDIEITESVSKPLDAYAATTLRISRTGRNEAHDLKKFRDAYALYIAATDLSVDLLKQAWNARTKLEMEALRAKARINTTQDAGLKMEATILALNELLMTVKEVAKDKNDEGRQAAANALMTLAIGTAVSIVVGLFLGWLIARVLSP